MSPRRLKVAVSGLGISRRFLDNYREAPETELVLLHDTNEARARKTSAGLGGVPWTTDYAAVLASGADFVDISTPNHVHAEQALAAFAAGKHVFCQKPLAPTVAECRRMVQAAREHGRLLGMFMSNLARPIAADLRRLVAEGLLGRPSSARARLGHRHLLQRERPSGDWRADRNKIGGGSFMQLGIHYLNYLLYLLDDEVESVQGFSANLHCRQITDAEDVTVALARLKGSGIPCVLESGYSGDGNALEVYGTGGFFALHYQALLLELSGDFRGQVIDYKRPPESKPPGKNPPVLLELAARGAGEARRNLHQEFARAIIEGRPAPVPGEIGLRDVATVQAIYRAAETGGVVRVADLLAEA